MSVASLRILKSGIRLPPLPTIRDLLKLYNLQAIKHQSQNFLLDERLTDKIVRSAGRIDPDDVVLEVGPGPGGITRSILRRQPHRLAVVEKDSRFLPTLQLLKDSAAKPLQMSMDIHIDDILTFNMEEYLKSIPLFRRLHLIGNLPFNISTRLIINWLEDISLRRGAFVHPDTRMTLTFQKEVAERICAPAFSHQRCRLSVMCQIWTKPLLKFLIPGKAFVPKPEVDAGIVKFIPLARPKTELPFVLVEKVIRHIFNMRQKYFRRGFSTLFPPDQREQITEHLLEKADIDGTLRPFQLTEEQCISMCEVYADFILQNPDIALYNYRVSKSRQESLLNDINLELNSLEMMKDHSVPN